MDSENENKEDMKPGKEWDKGNGLATDGTRIKHGFGRGKHYNGAKKAGSREPKAGRRREKAGSLWADTIRKRANLRKGGQKVGKRTGLAHFETALTRLFPHDSMQVVDFPHLSTVRVFLTGVKFSFQSQAVLGTAMGNGVQGVLEYWKGRGRGVACEIMRNNYGFLRIFPRSFTILRTEQALIPRCLASQARHKLDAPNGLFACAKRGRMVTGGTNFLIRKPGCEENRNRKQNEDHQA